MGLGEGQTTWWRLKSRTEGKRSAAHAVHCLFLGKMRVVLRTLMMEIEWKHLSIPTRIHAVIVFAWNILKSYRASVGVRMVHPQLVSHCCVRTLRIHNLQVRSKFHAIGFYATSGTPLLLPNTKGRKHNKSHTSRTSTKFCTFGRSTHAGLQKTRLDLGI